jgi:glycosyltransferase involved in cell wall biosynthesis
MLERIPQSPPKIEPLATTVNRPKWSVMIPSYNCTHYLRKTIQSVLAQALPADEMQIEVVDDHSTDGDVEALVKEVGNDRIGFYRQPKNSGSLRNFETCINRAKGEYVHILHGDDMVRSGFYHEIGDLFNKYPDAGAAFTGCTDMDENDKPIWDSKIILPEPGVIDNWLLQIGSGQLLQTPCMVVKRSVYEHLGSFFAVHYGEDWEMWTRIAASYPVAYSPKPLAYYRVHSSNITSNSFISGQNIKDILKVVDIIQDYFPVDKRKELKKMAIQKYAAYIAIQSHHLYHNNNPKAALIQAKKAFKMHYSRSTFYPFVKILVKVIIGYKSNSQKTKEL